MKCLCGYENNDGRWGKEGQTIKDDGEKFIYIKGMFRINKDDYRETSVDLYACPKCNTVQMYDGI